MNSPTSHVRELAERITEADATIAVAESLTGGQLSSALAAAPDASDWFRGGLVAYASEVKFDVLGVTPGPVVTAQCAEEMATGIERLLTARVGVGVTGVGGPDPEEGRPAGTVFAAVSTQGRVVVREWHFDGEPEEVLEQTIDAIIRLVQAELSQPHAAADTPGERS